MRLLVESVRPCAQRNVDPGDEHVLQVLSVERVQHRVPELLLGPVNVPGRSQVHLGGGREVARGRRVDHGAPLEVSLQGGVVPGDDQLLEGERERKWGFFLGLCTF